MGGPGGRCRLGELPVADGPAPGVQAKALPPGVPVGDHGRRQGSGRGPRPPRDRLRGRQPQPDQGRREQSGHRQGSPGGRAPRPLTRTTVGPGGTHRGRRPPGRVSPRDRSPQPAAAVRPPPPEAAPPPAGRTRRAQPGRARPTAPAPGRRRRGRPRGRPAARAHPAAVAAAGLAAPAAVPAGAPAGTRAHGVAPPPRQDPGHQPVRALERVVGGRPPGQREQGRQDEVAVRVAGRGAPHPANAGTRPLCPESSSPQAATGPGARPVRGWTRAGARVRSPGLRQGGDPGTGRRRGYRGRGSAPGPARAVDGRFGDALVGCGRFGLPGAGQAGCQASVDAVLAPPGVDRLGGRCPDRVPRPRRCVRPGPGPAPCGGTRRGTHGVPRSLPQGPRGPGIQKTDSEERGTHRSLHHSRYGTPRGDRSCSVTHRICRFFFPFPASSTITFLFDRSGPRLRT
ncbi:hypothetical protein SUDANB121_05581 [Nocardiopsis dassonvillei]